MRTKAVRIIADDGCCLRGTLFETAGGNNEVCVLINAAAGVAQGYYAAFAKFLAEQGFTVLTYDYRGIGASCDDDPSTAPPTLLDWGGRDLPAAIDWLTRERPGYGLVVLGHSFGGQAPGMAWNNDRIRGLLGISSPFPYYGHWPWYFRPLLRLFYKLPSLARLQDRRMGGLLEIPESIRRNWIRWSLLPDYVQHEQAHALREHFNGFRGRLRLYCISDDRLHAPQRAIEALGRAYANAGMELVKVSPQDWDLDAIGHLGFFRSSTPRAAWQEAADWLLSAGRIPKPELIEV